MEQTPPPNNIDSVETKGLPTYNVEILLGQVPGVSHVEKIDLDDDYLKWAKDNLDPELYESIQSNYKSVDAYRYKYLSGGLLIAGFLWTPKNMKHSLPLVVWNRGGTETIGSIDEERGAVYLENTECELVKQGTIVIASAYRGGIGSEGKDECGGADVHDVTQVKKIADQLPFCKSEKAIVAGVSRGGMMSYLLASREPWVKAVISFSGTTDLISLAKDRPEMDEVFINCFGGSDEEKRKRSAVHFYPEIPRDLPILIFHGSDDNRVSVEQVRRFHELLRTSGHAVEYHEFEGAGHGLDVVGSPDSEKVLSILQDFLKKQLSRE